MNRNFVMNKIFFLVLDLKCFSVSDFKNFFLLYYISGVQPFLCKPFDSSLNYINLRETFFKFRLVYSQIKSNYVETLFIICNLLRILIVLKKYILK